MNAPTKQVLDTGMRITLTGKLVDVSFYKNDDGTDRITQSGGKIVKWKVYDGRKYHFIDEFVGSKFELPANGLGIRMDLKLSEDNFTKEWDDIPNRYGYKLSVVDAVTFPLVTEDGEIISV